MKKARFDLDYHRTNESKYYYPRNERKEYLSVIETTLKEYQTLKREYDFSVEHYNELLNEYNKEHKALEIIKKTQVNIFTVIHSKDYEDFRKKCFDVNCLYLRFPTQEEFNLLKEVLL